MKINTKIDIKDELRSSSNDIKGRVIIREKTKGDSDFKTIEDTSNLVVYRGRDWLLQRALNTSLSSRSDWNTKFISWIALGSGGTVVGSPLVPVAPTMADYQLNTPVSVGAGSDYVTVGGVDYKKFDASYPKLLADTTVTDTLDGSCTSVDPIDSLTYSCDQFLIGQVKVSISGAEYNGGGSTNISEAGLFISPSNSLGYGFSAGDMNLFARVTFASIVKDSSKELLLTWLMYF